MAFVLKLSEEEQAALKQQADREHRSMHEVVVLAVRERIGRTQRALVLDSIVDSIVVEDAKLLEILANS
jgi:hypothetical protein